MDYNVLLFTRNDCYKKSKKMKPKGIVVHSTGVNNPNLKRYLGPDDGRIGNNANGNHWNRPGIEKAVHAFIGKDKRGRVCTYQTLPTNICCWGAGKGSKGSYNYNPAYLQFEILEDDLKDKSYFNLVMKEAQELCAKWCVEFNIPVANVVSHAEAYGKGYASNHADCDHWLKRYGKNMSWFRSQVTKLVKALTADIQVGDKIKIKDSVTSYYDGKKFPSWLRNVTLYARKLETKDGVKVWLVSTNKVLPVYTGRFKFNDVEKR